YVEKNSQLHDGLSLIPSDLPVMMEPLDQPGREKDTGMTGPDQPVAESEDQGIRFESGGRVIRTERLPENQAGAPSIQRVKAEGSFRNQNPAYLMHNVFNKEVFDRHRAEKPSDPLQSEKMEGRIAGLPGFENREIKNPPVKRSQPEPRVEGDSARPAFNPEAISADSEGPATVLVSTGSHETGSVQEIAETPAPPAAEETPSQQVFRHLKMTINHQQKEAVIHLKPESLGNVIVHLKMEGSEVEALFQVENEEVHHQLKRNMDQLIESMRDQNITLTKTEIAIIPAEKSSQNSTTTDQAPLHQEESARSDQQSSHQRQPRKDTQDVWDDWEKHKRSRRFNYLA
ncbi:MAG: flagellar hook-length control protein FliK, partial [Candidatus Delongbacteria bacterium]|nr:flagellar hook-length control protein FliK [Candidatus Delongbacteria bacterium]